MEFRIRVPLAVCMSEFRGFGWLVFSCRLELYFGLAVTRFGRKT